MAAEWIDPRYARLVAALRERQRAAEAAGRVLAPQRGFVVPPKG